MNNKYEQQQKKWSPSGFFSCFRLLLYNSCSFLRWLLLTSSQFIFGIVCEKKRKKSSCALHQGLFINNSCTEPFINLQLIPI